MAQIDKNLAPRDLSQSSVEPQSLCTMPSAPSLEVRNFRFELGPSVPRHWHGGRRAISLYYDNLSIFFPAGERFFIASVKAHAHLVRDPELQRDVRAFCGQEGVHGREHVRYNRMLDAQGYPVADMERRLEARLRRIAGWVPLRRQLAITCALEHFTAVMGHTVLSDPRLLAGAEPEMAALWRWHAAEENEHKAVAFDVYRCAGGNYFERVSAMLGATLVFWILVSAHQLRLMRADGCLFSSAEWRALFVFLFNEPGPMRLLGSQYFQYYRPGFHPWQLDNRELLNAWRSKPIGPAAGSAPTDGPPLDGSRAA
jgi:predicted metal-dependent hydrolase